MLVPDAIVRSIPIISSDSNALKKVALNYKELLADNPGDPENIGGWHRIDHKKKITDK